MGVCFTGPQWEDVVCGDFVVKKSVVCESADGRDVVSVDLIEEESMNQICFENYDISESRKGVVTTFGCVGTFRLYFV